MLKSSVGALLLVAVALTPGARPGLARAAQDASPDAALERAMALHRAGDTVGAIDAYLAILETSPDRADVRSNLGAAYALGLSIPQHVLLQATEVIQ